MKVKFQRVTPILFDQKLYEKVNRVIEEGVKKSLSTMSFEEQKRLLADYKHVLARFIENVSNHEEEFVKNQNYKVKKVVHYETYADVRKRTSYEYIKRLKKSLMKGNCVVPAGTVETVLYKNEKLDSIDLSNAKQVFDMFPKSEFDRVSACANVSEQNKVFIINGCFDGASENVVPLDQIVAWVDIENSEIVENDKFAPKRSVTGEHVKSKDDYDFVIDEVSFALPCNLDEIKEELNEPYDMRIEPFDDIFHESKRFFKNYFDKNNPNKPSNTTLRDGALEIMQQIEYVSEAMEKFEIEQNNIANQKLAEQVCRDL